MGSRLGSGGGDFVASWQSPSVGSVKRHWKLEREIQAAYREQLVRNRRGQQWPLLAVSWKHKERRGF